jgi:hypothetical protein
MPLQGVVLSEAQQSQRPIAMSPPYAQFARAKEARTCQGGLHLRRGAAAGCGGRGGASVTPWCDACARPHAQGRDTRRASSSRKPLESVRWGVSPWLGAGAGDNWSPAAARGRGTIGPPVRGRGTICPTVLGGMLARVHVLLF